MADRLICPTPPRAGDAACLRPLGVVLEVLLVQSRHICLCLEIDLLDRRRTANEAQVDASGRVDGGGRMTGVAESEAERHREAGGVHSCEQLLGIDSFAVVELGQDTSEAGPARVGGGPYALTNRQLTRARLQIACPPGTAITGRHG